MDSRKRAQHPQRESWAECSFIDYLNAVDGRIELETGGTSTQEELELISEMQEAFVFPFDCAISIIQIRMR